MRPTSSSLHCPLPALCVGPLSYIARVVQASQAGHIGQGLHVSTETVATQIPAEHGIGFCGLSTRIRLTQPLQLIRTGVCVVCVRGVRVVYVCVCGNMSVSACMRVSVRENKHKCLCVWYACVVCGVCACGCVSVSACMSMPARKNTNVCVCVCFS